MKNQEPEKPPNQERGIIFYADFPTLLLATFVVMYAVSTINSSKFQEMAESFSTAFMGRTATLKYSACVPPEKGPFTFMPTPVPLPVASREVMVKDAPPALRQEETVGDPEHPNDHGQFLARGGAATETQAEYNPAVSVQDQVAQRIQNLDAAFEQLN